MPTPDQKYIDALLNNDFTILEELYQKFSGKIKSLVMRNHGNETDAADVFQNALLSIYYRARKNGLTLTCSFEAFLYVVCKNKWNTELKKRRKKGVTFQEMESYSINEDCFAQAEDCKVLAERQELITEKLNELGESCRQLLTLSWSGKRMDEIAKTLNITYTYARKKKSECMARLAMLVKQSSQYNFLKR